jgi:uncharacterized SAM-binding protein YcdF (DUF218 family)
MWKRPVVWGTIVWFLMTLWIAASLWFMWVFNHEENMPQNLFETGVVLSIMVGILIFAATFFLRSLQKNHEYRRKK